MSDRMFRNAHTIARQRYESTAAQVKALHEKNLRELSADLKRITPERKKTEPKPAPVYKRKPEPERQRSNTAKAEQAQDQQKEAFKAKRRRTPTAERKSRRRSNNPDYNKNGPSLSR